MVDFAFLGNVPASRRSADGLSGYVELLNSKEVETEVGIGTIFLRAQLDRRQKHLSISDLGSDPIYYDCPTNGFPISDLKPQNFGKITRISERSI